MNIYKESHSNVKVLRLCIRSERHGTRLLVFNERNPTHIHLCTDQRITTNCCIQKLPLAKLHHVHSTGKISSRCLRQLLTTRGLAPQDPSVARTLRLTTTQYGSIIRPYKFRLTTLIYLPIYLTSKSQVYLIKAL